MSSGADLITNLHAELTDATHARMRGHYMPVARESGGIAVKLMAKYDNELPKVEGKWLIKDFYIVFGQ